MKNSTQENRIIPSKSAAKLKLMSRDVSLAEMNTQTEIKKEGQATKSARGMPWHWEPMKDVVNCDKLRGAVSKHYIRRFPNGATCLFEEQSTYGE